MSEQTSTRLTQNQWRGFFASWGGWALDGMDSYIFALVMVPALKELLPRSGLRSDLAGVGYYGGLLFALFLVGWGCAFLWGPFADKYGRVRTLMLTILWYSLFTFLCCLSTRVWQLAVFRFLAGIGIGGEWAMGGTFVAEEWPEDRRKMAAGWMHTGYYVGFFLAGLANYLVGAHYGWRAMFALGGLPALLVSFIRYGVKEPARWKNKAAELRSWSIVRPIAQLFAPEFRKRTVLNSIYVLISIVGLWAGSVYVPAAVGELAGREKIAGVSVTHLVSLATMLLSVATILGCIVLPVLAERWGRRGTLALYYVCMMLSIAIGFGYAFYLPAHALQWFLVCLVFLGLGGANFAMYTLWLPEQYPTECRGSAFAFATSVGRFFGAGFTFLVGAGVAHFHTIGIPVALTSIAFGVGLLVLPFGYETKGKTLPA
ncbi:MAG TPA: MFS transporter [Candidatus Dormibacteraeota bacterium]|nr:MFS transporter [Candidatus Dormibacteraeota bacterium]